MKNDIENIYNINDEKYMDTLEGVHWNERLGFYNDIGPIDDTYPHTLTVEQERNNRNKVKKSLLFSRIGFACLVIITQVLLFRQPQKVGHTYGVNNCS